MAQTGAIKESWIRQQLNKFYKFVGGVTLKIDLSEIVSDIESSKKLTEQIRKLTHEIEKKEQRLLDSESKYRRQFNLLNNVIEAIPDLFWVKDKDNRFIITNKALREKLLLTTDPKYPLGKTGEEIADEIISRGIEYNAGRVCSLTDEMTKQAGKPCTFLEDFMVDNKPLYLVVHKSPFYHESEGMAGTIGIGRDVTSEVLEHKELAGLLKCCTTCKDANACDFKESFENHCNANYISEHIGAKLISFSEEG